MSEVLGVTRVKLLKLIEAGVKTDRRGRLMPRDNGLGKILSYALMLMTDSIVMTYVMHHLESKLGVST